MTDSETEIIFKEHEVNREGREREGERERVRESKREKDSADERRERR